MFFILYINDLGQLPVNLQHTEVFMYADDAKLLAPVLDENAILAIQRDIDLLHHWCSEWRLNLNPKKCFYLHYTPRNFKAPLHPQYTINNTPIERKEKVSDLGVILSEDLSFHSHIDNICKTAKREINRVRRTFKCRTSDFLANTYKTYVRPQF